MSLDNSGMFAKKQNANIQKGSQLPTGFDDFKLKKNKKTGNLGVKKVTNPGDNHEKLQDQSFNNETQASTKKESKTSSVRTSGDFSQGNAEDVSFFQKSVSSEIDQRKTMTHKKGFKINKRKTGGLNGQKKPKKKYHNFQVSTEESELRDSLLSIQSSISYKNEGGGLTKSEIKLQNLSKEADQIYFDSSDDVLSLIDKQLSSLEDLDSDLKKREENKRDLIEGVKLIKGDSGVIDLPENYEDVVDRVSEEVIQERKLMESGNFVDSDPFKKANESSGNEVVGDLDGFNRTGKIINMVKKKLESTLYSFKNFSKGQEIKIESGGEDNGEPEGGLRDQRIVKKIQKVMENDRALSMAEKEEKAVKSMIAKERAKRQRELKEIEENSEILNRSVTSAKSTQSNNSRLFMTQKRDSGRKGRNMKRKFSKKKFKKTKLQPIKKLSKSHVQAPKNQTCNSKHHSRIKSAKNFVKKNIKSAFLSQHEKFINSLTKEQKVRYEKLKNEAEQISERPEMLEEIKIRDYYSVYGEYYEFLEKNGDVDAKEIEKKKSDLIVNKDSKGVFKQKKVDDGTMDVEYKRMKKNLGKLDEKIYRLNMRWNGEGDDEELMKVRRNELNEYLEHEKKDEQKMKEILDNIDMSGFDKLEDLDKKSQEILDKINPGEAIKALEQMKIDMEEAKVELTKEFNENLKVQKYQEFKQSAQKAITETKGKIDKLDLEEFKEENYEKKFQEEEDKIKGIRNEVDSLCEKIDMGSQNMSEIFMKNLEVKEALKELPKRNLDRLEEEIEFDMKKKYPEVYDEGVDGDELYIRFLHLIEKEK